MTTRAAAEKAVVTYKETQPALDAIKTTMARNSAAKKTLGAYMIEQNLPSFRGVTLKLVPSLRWDNDKLLAYLGDKAQDFRKSVNSKYFDIIKRTPVK